MGWIVIYLLTTVTTVHSRNDSAVNEGTRAIRLVIVSDYTLHVCILHYVSTCQCVIVLQHIMHIICLIMAYIIHCKPRIWCAPTTNQPMPFLHRVCCSKFAVIYSMETLEQEVITAVGYLRITFFRVGCINHFCAKTCTVWKHGLWYSPNIPPPPPPPPPQQKNLQLCPWYRRFPKFMHFLSCWLWSCKR